MAFAVSTQLHFPLTPLQRNQFKNSSPRAFFCSCFKSRPDSSHLRSKQLTLLVPKLGSAPRHRQKFQVKVGTGGEFADSGEVADSLASDAPESFSWSSVILPFIFPALGGLLFGYDIGATSGATLSLQSAALSGTTWFNLSPVQLGLVVSGSLYGALLGSTLVYGIADFLGRRRELIIAAGLYLLGSLITGCAPDLNVLLLGRLLYGLGIGLAMHGAPLYIAETCPSQIRGTLISLKELFIVLGILLGFSVGSFEIDVVGGWRYMYGFGTPVALLMGLGMWSLPPSPRWLLLRAVQGKGALQEYKDKAMISFGPISWLMVSEIFPLRTRGRGISLAVLTNFGSNAIVTFAFSPLKEYLGAENLFLLFGAIALVSLLFVVLVVPETKGLSLEEIESKILK
ncbi:hypothetical protein F2Q70_00005489 [Brassica cretica]|uniref:Major facilitator superfamily (MFS) profile domain-containing protein n=1 Tax=Brassica cretica TaxID=69181 RepID=A0A8S9IMQ2_BRACR|nr:hypothetical protein F2Q70_00005489 [Brassica cretica]